MEECISLLQKINSLETEMEKLSQSQMKEKTTILKKRISEGESLDNLLVEAFALVREAGKRTLNMRHFDVQIIGGIVLHKGKIAEMATGEGKTLVATLPLYLNALEGKGCHLVTVNDYLAKRDTQWMGPIFHLLGLSVGCIVSYRETGTDTPSAFIFDPTYLPSDSRYLNLRPISRREAYRCDITYGVGSEFGFDYLRDNMALNLSQQVQRELNYAIIDEVDSILIDEARTPLIISGPAEESTQLYYQIDKLVRKLNKDTDFILDEEAQSVSLTDDGIRKCERLLGIQNLYDGSKTELVHHINQALRAHNFFKRDKEYVVKNGEVIIVDEFTGRLMPGRRWSDGLHQAIEAKEGVRIESENQTLATISFQNYFKLYKKIAGMTGTALTEGIEFKEIYKLDVIAIPTNKPLRRTEYDDEIYKTEREKLNAVVSEIESMYKIGRPVLVGTISIEKAEKLSKILKHRNIPHQVLHGKNHEAEAGIIAQAGRPKMVTIATQMAGRGVDIILGGNPEILAREETIKVIWSKKAKSASPKGQKSFHEIINEAEELYKRKVEETEKIFKEKIEILKNNLSEKEKIFSEIDEKAKEIFEREIFVKKGGEEFLKLEEKLKNLKEKYKDAQNSFNQAQIEYKNKPKKISDPVKEIKEILRNAYNEYEGFKLELRRKFGIFSRQDIEEKTNNIMYYFGNPEISHEEMKKILNKEFTEYLSIIHTYEEVLQNTFHGKDEPIKEFLGKSNNYHGAISSLIKILDRINQENYKDIMTELGNKLNSEYQKYISALETCEKEILIKISGENYIKAENEYKKVLSEYEEEQSNYESMLSKIREEYENIRTKYEEEWKKAKEELEKNPEEFKSTFESLLEKYKQPWLKDHQYVVELGGLHIIGTERYESRRIDNQLKGRAGRQGDPGSSKYYLSLEDDLLRIFGSERLMGIMSHLPEGEKITHPLITKMINNAQKKVEGRNFEIRKQLLEFDNVMNEQRKIIYSLRQDILEGKKLDSYIEDFIEDSIEESFDLYLNLKLKPEMWNLSGLKTYFKNTFNILPEISLPDNVKNHYVWREELKIKFLEMIKNLYNKKKEELKDLSFNIEQIILLQAIDSRWKSHLRTIDELREGIGLRAYAQKDPLIAYKHEGFQMFQEMLSVMKNEVLGYLFKIQLTETHIPSAEKRQKEPVYVHQSFNQFDTVLPKYDTSVQVESNSGRFPQNEMAQTPIPIQKPQIYKREMDKVGRNQPCPCGSGKKYKKCCGKNV